MLFQSLLYRTSVDQSRSSHSRMPPSAWIVLISFMSILVPQIHCKTCAEDVSFEENLASHNQIAYHSILQLHRSNDQWWGIPFMLWTDCYVWMLRTFVNSKDEVTVHKKYLQDSPTYLQPQDVKAGKKHAIVKSSGIIAASPKTVFDLFLNNRRVKEYNEHCEIVRDVHLYPKHSHGHWCKIAWAASPKYGVFRAREFCSVVAYYVHDSNGTYYILNRPAYLSKCPTSDKYVRATILLAGNIIEPYGPGGNQTRFTQIAHINPGGGADTTAVAWLINKLCAFGPPTFIRKLEIAAQKSVNDNGNMLSLKDRMEDAIRSRLPSVSILAYKKGKQVDYRRSGRSLMTHLPFRKL